MPYFVHFGSIPGCHGGKLSPFITTSGVRCAGHIVKSPVILSGVNTTTWGYVSPESTDSYVTGEAN